METYYCLDAWKHQVPPCRAVFMQMHALFFGHLPLDLSCVFYLRTNPKRRKREIPATQTLPPGPSWVSTLLRRHSRRYSVERLVPVNSIVSWVSCWLKVSYLL